MIVKATVAFAGAVTMAEDEVRDVREDIAAPLVNCGYLIPVEVTPAEPDQAPKKAEKAAPKEKEEK